METGSAKVVRYLLAYLSVQKWLVGGRPLKINFFLKVNHPLVGGGPQHRNEYRLKIGDFAPTGDG